MSENTIIVSLETKDALMGMGRQGESCEKIIYRLMKDYKDKLEGRKIVYKELGYMITFEDESGLVMIRDLDGGMIDLRHMLKIVDLVKVTEHNEAKGKKKKKEPTYNPNIFLRVPVHTPDMTVEERLASIGRRRAVVMGQISWLFNENKDYKKLTKELPSLKKELAEIDKEIKNAK